MIYRWVIKKLYEDGDAEVRIINQSTGKEQKPEYKTQEEIRAIAKLPADAKLYEGQAFTVTDTDMEEGESKLSETSDEVKTMRAVGELPEEEMLKIKKLFSRCMDAHDIKEVFYSEQYSELMKTHPILEKFRKYELKKHEEELQVPRKTYVDKIDRLRYELSQMNLASQENVNEHLEHAFNHPLMAEYLQMYPQLGELKKLLLEEVLPNPRRKLEAEEKAKKAKLEAEEKAKAEAEKKTEEPCTSSCGCETSCATT